MLVTDVLVLSVYYHRLHEPAGTGLARTEAFFAFLLYLYGVAQLYNTDAEQYTSMFLACLFMLCAVTLTYLSGQIFSKEYWDKTHYNYIGMHILPALCMELMAAADWHGYGVSSHKLKDFSRRGRKGVKGGEGRERE